MTVLIREGSAARNFDTLIPLLKEFPDKVMFCSDDKHPDELLRGHINELVGRALRLGYDLFDVLRACTHNPVMHYGLKIGLLKVGDPADFILLDTLETFVPRATYVNGQKIAENGQCLFDSVQTDCPNNFHARSLQLSDLAIPALEGRILVQQALEGQLVTSGFLTEPLMKEGYCVSDPERDILKMLVMNRYAPADPALGFVRYFGLKSGAIASTVAHDSHNIIAVGANDDDLVAAVNLLVREKGGIACVRGDEVHFLPLPVAGIMSPETGSAVAAKYALLDHIAREMGSGLQSPFMTLSFMSLLVIPSIKLSDKGLFDSDHFEFVPLFQK
jgi:adenine deaminase